MAKIYGSSTFRIIGTAATGQNLFTIENGSQKLVVIRELTIQSDQTAALTAVAALVKTTRLAAFPTGGTVLVKVPFNTGDPSESTVILRGANASDGGVASAITATPADTIYQQYILRNHTAAGQVMMAPQPLLPKLNFKSGEILDLTLNYNQSLLVHILAAAAGSNPATNFYVVNCIWEEI
jgi:hypothetical protein